MELKIQKEWHKVLKDELSLPYIQELKNFLNEEEREEQTIYPPPLQIFQAFASTPFEQAKVVIIGQDPYHGPGQAHGLCFSVQKGIPFPPSLKNIFKELEEDVGINKPKHGCLLSWAEQGVFLLNNTLTVRRGEPKSHFGKGWERFTDAAVKALCERGDPLIFLLWGKPAQEKCQHILAHNQKHLVLKAAHPSPFSAHQGFLGCRHFSKTNEQLMKWGHAPINWEIPE